MKILGINAFGHDTSAALVIDGKLIAAVEEERLNREKSTRTFPHLSIEYCLKEANIKFEDVDYITYAYQPYLWLTHRFLYHQLRFFPQALGELKYVKRMISKFMFLKSNIQKELKTNKPIILLKHHDAHMGSTFLVSPFEEAAILTLDGLGEYETSVQAVGKGTSIKRLDHILFPNSLGSMYACISHFVGYTAELDEGKVMGLAAYGDASEYYNDFKKLVKLKKDGTFQLDLSYFEYHKKRDTWVSDKFYKVFGPRRAKNEEMTSRYINVAAAAQKVLEDTVLHISESLYNRTKMKAICLAGGVALNSVANGRIVEQGLFKDIFIQPASGDNGLPIGAAFYVYNTLKKQKRVFVERDTYLGPKYPEQDIISALKKYNLPVYKSDSVAKETAAMLTNKNVIGLYQGRMEFGPRALGNRSIIADPRFEDMKDIVNEKVKFREAYRPFAPAILADHCKDYFENDYTSPYMLLVYKARPFAKDKIPAVVHQDGTGRVQTVEKDINPRYYNIIEEFYKITNVPVIMNTSFNIKDEPIVCNPEDAVRCFLGTNIDALVLEDYIVKKTDIDMSKYGNQEDYRHNRGQASKH
ncbi:carbamoyltransferase family protein [Leptospira borgpetersenii]|uniref:Carbamoyl transferase n=2 Tax=Leptospira borgpetersenii serovar Hardjo-bovis TaxID=338217 RepID=Q04TN9_LEPBJ|nr:carbamoyltransferase C-terminal domain-containing protein [Leptospira borgpetersenii]ABJ75731.1 Carbamoyl transferase [Leptospira borgpetersenii serovar Hardjo-bovis str. JB197]ABJ78675.1 Carbamoyl transferase [Leptospira borgpetersenii serovar Hardjo-bovis str. L550]AMX57962.1 carbamoyl transferase [Leptospira borgpetersenii serovar Hardjo]AMX61193.1 carbamoyl transferase [Leptospira borgpetersenii serovar Hardjo]AMX64437.1 carbamoyl transferase [Leptospira borgpetersenii serovar Hardjo]